MTAIKPTQSVKSLYQFIRQNKRLIHLNLSGMLHSEKQVRSIIKAISKSETLLALHLSHTQIIQESQPLQAYILSKLRMQQISRKKKNKLKTRDNAILKQKLSRNWLERDNLKAECQQEEKLTEYFESQRVADTTNDFFSMLILQRTIGHPSLLGNEQWIGSSECYVCQRW